MLGHLTEALRAIIFNSAVSHVHDQVLAKPAGALLQKKVFLFVFVHALYAEGKILQNKIPILYSRYVMHEIRHAAESPLQCDGMC